MYSHPNQVYPNVDQCPKRAMIEDPKLATVPSMAMSPVVRATFPQLSRAMNVTDALTMMAAV